MIGARLLDAGALCLLATLGALLALRRASPPGSPHARRAWRAVWTALGVTWLLATPAVANTAMSLLEPAPVDPHIAIRGYDPRETAIVVLSSGVGPPLPGFSASERLDGACTARVIGAARVYHAIAPAAVIVTGRALGPVPEATARAMRELLVRLGVPGERVATETAARTTRENARFSVAMARARGWRRLVVVTSASHTPRAMREFARAGADAVAVPVDYVGPRFASTLDLIPAAGALARSQQVLHELLGVFRP